MVLAEDGDILLLLADGSRIRAYSTVLSLASPVFKAMLGPHFKEGQERGSALSPKEISLPDDDPCSMKEIAYLLHFQTFDGSQPNDQTLAQAILRIAMLADKYGCTDAMHMLSHGLLSRFLTQRSTKSLDLVRMYDLVAAAYLFNRPELFELFTRRIMLDNCAPFASILTSKSGMMLPTSVLRE
jgi:hypothetical protein